MGCYAQYDYQARLLEIQQEIRELPSFNNSAVVYPDSSQNLGWGGRWESMLDFYKDDMVSYYGNLYRAVADSRGKVPPVSPQEWVLVRTNYHPYQFLRDTAAISDLTALTASDHPYIRLYSFAALVRREYDALFQIILANLAETTQVMQLTDDYGFEICPADLMLFYAVDNFSNSQKDSLRTLIISRYTHLSTLEDVLLFQKPQPGKYAYIRDMAKNGTGGKFSLIALSRYKKRQDIELIRKGFSNDDYYAGYRVFFMAVENFPEQSLEGDLIEYGNHITIAPDMTGYKYFFNALAAYKSDRCFKMLLYFSDEMIRFKHKSLFANESKARNLKLIYQALKKYYAPRYDDLIKKIDRNLPADEDSLYYRDLEDSPWNY